MSARGKQEERTTPSRRKSSAVVSSSSPGDNKNTDTPRPESRHDRPRSAISSSSSLSVTTSGTTSSLKAQLESVRYPAGQQRRRVVTTQITGTPKRVATGHGRERTAPAVAVAVSSPISKGLSSSPSKKQIRVETASPLASRVEADGVGRRPVSEMSSSPLRRPGSVAKGTRPPLPISARTPSKLKLRNSTSAVHMAAGRSPASTAKTPANSPASGRSSVAAMEPLAVVNDK
ncbi:unnamed protein product [Discula destructiva]